MTEYTLRRERQRGLAARAARWDAALGWSKLGVFFLLLGLAWLAWVAGALRAAWLLPVGLLLAGLFVAHDRALRARLRADRLVAYYDRLLARAADRWAGLGESGDGFAPEQHPYAADLDIFGRGGLFELVCQARTSLGQRRLADWLLAPAPPAEVRRRQERVRALRPELDLRERIAALGQELQAELSAPRLRAWAGTPARLGPWARAALAAGGAAVLAGVAYGLAAARYGWTAAALVAAALALRRFQGAAAAAVGGRGANGQGLRLFAGVLGLSGRVVAGDVDAAAGAAALRRLATLSDWADVVDTTMGHVLDFLLLYRLQIACGLDAWRRRYGAALEVWLDQVAECEALLSLASLAYERSEDAFPELADDTAEPVWAAEELGHPLLPGAACVRNDVRLDAGCRLLLVSGSNMSGKSTLLRAVGVATVLAQAGAPVRARRLRLTPTLLATRLRSGDSLQLGRSGFYAEILRLRQVFELAGGARPLLFLLDELLEGTNSHDRNLGARGLLRALLARPTLGLVTTHDLALATLAAEEPRIHNVHFDDQIQGGDIRFDYRLREGVVTTSSALALMRLVGLEV
jgi:hypothetical protein